MKKTIEYYYNLYPNLINYYSNYMLFNTNNIDYIMVETNKSENEIKDIMKLLHESRKKGCKFHEIINNNFNRAITAIDDKKYVLLKLCDNPKRVIDIIDIIDNEGKSIIASRKVYSCNWSSLWKKKIDYYEKQMYSFALNKTIIINSFSYYIGLAENAINYFNNYQTSNKDSYVSDHMSICRRRVFFPNIWLNYGNPLSFVIDIPLRDEVEYIKNVFFYGKINDAYDCFNLTIKLKKLNNNSANLFMSRMLFPTYYFDIYERVITNIEKQELVIDILKRRREYEIFLKYCYSKLSTVNALNDLPNWLL